MKLNSILILLLLLLSYSHGVNAGNATFDSANTAYSQKEYDKAIQLYESIVTKNIEAPELYFNLGNAYYKTNNLGLAILNYERAKKLAPNDEDIAANLKIANLKIEDKIEPAPQLFLTEWKDSIINIMSEKKWSLLTILFVIISFLLFSIYATSTNRNLKQLGFFGGGITVFCYILLFFAAQSKYNITKFSKDAIITSASVTINSSPDEKGTKLFILHEGTKVLITEENFDWTEIKIANGNVGWIKTSELKRI